MQHDSAQQHASPTRGPPRNALVRLACCSAAACELLHAHAKKRRRNEFKRIPRAKVCSETNSSMQMNLRRAAREWHASRALGGGAYPHHAGQSLHARGAARAAAPPAQTQSQRERPQASQRSQAASSIPHCGPKWKLSFRHRHPHVPCRPKPRRGDRGHAEASIALMCAYAWKPLVH